MSYCCSFGWLRITKLASNSFVHCAALYFWIFQLVRLNHRNSILDKRISVCSFVLYLLLLPPWILKQEGLESCGQRLISWMGKGERIQIFWFFEKSFYSWDFFRIWFFSDFFIFLYFFLFQRFCFMEFYEIFQIFSYGREIFRGFPFFF